MISRLPHLDDDHVVLLALDKQTLDAYKQNPFHKEIWAMGHHRYGIDMATRIFEAHERGYIERRQVPRGSPNWLKNLRQQAQTKPIYCLHEWPEPLGPGHCRFVPDCKQNNVGKPFIESSVGYMLACALHVHKYSPIRKISLYGISFNTTLQYAYQRPNSLYYVARLEEAGVTFEYPLDGCKIFASAWPSGLYGLEENLDTESHK